MNKKNGTNFYKGEHTASIWSLCGYPAKTSPLSIHSCIFEIFYRRFPTMSNLLKKRKARRANITRLLAPHFMTESPRGYSNAKWSKNGRFWGLSCNVRKRRKDNASLAHIDSTTILNMFSSKNIMKKKKTWTVERRRGVTYIILAKFEARFMGDFERIQNLPFARVSCFLHESSSPWSFVPFLRIAV